MLGRWVPDVQRWAHTLGVASLATLLGVAVTAGFVFAGEDGPTRPEGRTGTPAGWVRVSGPPDAHGRVTSYAVPGGASWKVGRVEGEVSYRDAGGTPYASGQAPAHYLGNRCSVDGRPHPGAWALLGVAGRGEDLAGYAVRSARAWARGYGGDAAATAISGSTSLALEDGTTAVRVDVRLDLSGFRRPCLGTRADLTVVAFRTGTLARSLVVARYTGVTGGLPTDVFERILGSVRVTAQSLRRRT